jgi:ABC-type dipeptide/oligopeptide/nickel transport system permease component
LLKTTLCVSGAYIHILLAVVDILLAVVDPEIRAPHRPSPTVTRR